MDEIMRAVNEIESGILWINAPVLDNDALPFGGKKLSGIGRQLGPEGLAQFQSSKFVMIDPKAEAQDFWWFPYQDAEAYQQAKPELQMEGSVKGSIPPPKTALLPEAFCPPAPSSRSPPGAARNSSD
jgi:hypothetical protein